MQPTQSRKCVIHSSSNRSSVSCLRPTHGTPLHLPPPSPQPSSAVRRVTRNLLEQGAKATYLSSWFMGQATDDTWATSSKRRPRAQRCVARAGGVHRIWSSRVSAGTGGGNSYLTLPTRLVSEPAVYLGWLPYSGKIGPDGHDVLP